MSAPDDVGRLSWPLRYSRRDTTDDAFLKGRACARAGFPRGFFPTTYADRPRLLKAWKWGWDHEQADRRAPAD